MKFTTIYVALSSAFGLLLLLLLSSTGGCSAAASVYNNDDEIENENETNFKIADFIQNAIRNYHPDSFDIATLQGIGLAAEEVDEDEEDIRNNNGINLLRQEEESIKQQQQRGLSPPQNFYCLPEITSLYDAAKAVLDTGFCIGSSENRGYCALVDALASDKYKCEPAEPNRNRNLRIQQRQLTTTCSKVLPEIRSLKNAALTIVTSTICSNPQYEFEVSDYGAFCTEVDSIIASDVCRDGD